jgi:hypothetical protein
LKDFSLESLAQFSQKIATFSKSSSSHIHSLVRVNEVILTSSQLEVMSYLATTTHAACCGRTAHFGESEAREISKAHSDVTGACSSSSACSSSCSSSAASSVSLTIAETFSVTLSAV